jgi:CheY-like chemotaxis protein
VARIVIIEDNPDNMELMAYLLRAFGHRVLPATDGEAGLALVRRERPELVLSDIHLPRVDGFEVARALKDDAQLARIPLVAVTALAQPGDRDRMRAAGFDGYLGKPIDPHRFVAQAEGFLQPGSATGPDVPARGTAPP